MKSQQKESLFYFHSQNLNEGGSGFWAGRAWLYIRGSWATGCIEWYFGKQAHHLSAYVGIGGEDGFTFHAGIPYLFAIWLCFSARPMKLPYSEYQTGITIHEEFIWLNIWRNEMDSRDAWLHWSFDWKKFLLGKQTYENEILNVFHSFVPLPEGDYPCTVQIERSTWKRPRWKAFTRNYATFKFEKPVPIPGKGENSWDMNDDAIFQTSVQLETGNPDDAAKTVVAKIRQWRERYGGLGWMPEPDKQG